MSEGAIALAFCTTIAIFAILFGVAPHQTVLKYMDETIAHAKEYGYVETLYGRRCHTPEINDRQHNRRGFSERAAINAPIQGGAADIIKRAMIKLPDALTGASLDAKMLLQVHDELIFEVPNEQLEEISDQEPSDKKKA